MLIVKCEKRDKSKELLSKKEPDNENVENCQPIHIVKNNKVFIENNKGMTVQLLHKEITHGFNQPSQQKLGIYQQRHCQFGLKGTKTDER